MVWSIASRKSPAGRSLALIMVLGLVVSLLVVPGTAYGAPIDAARYVPLAPERVLDTRDATGDVDAPVGAGETVSTTVAGVGGVPADAAAVAINVTAANATAMSHLRVWPSGSPTPLASTINFQPGVNIANMVITEVGDDGKVDIFNFRGSVDVIFDVVGYFESAPAGSLVLSFERGDGSAVDEGVEVAFQIWPFGDEAAALELTDVTDEAGQITVDGLPLTVGAAAHLVAVDSVEGFVLADGQDAAQSFELTFDGDVAEVTYEVALPAAPEITLAGPQDPVVAGVATEGFSATVVNAGEVALDENVEVRFTIAGEQDLTSDDVVLEYDLEGTWVALTLTEDEGVLTGRFGPSDGFALPAGYDATTELRVTFEQPGDYTATAAIFGIDTDTAFDTDTLEVEVVAPAVDGAASSVEVVSATYVNGESTEVVLEATVIDERGDAVTDVVDSEVFVAVELTGAVTGATLSWSGTLDEITDAVLFNEATGEDTQVGVADSYTFANDGDGVYTVTIEGSIVNPSGVPSDYDATISVRDVEIGQVTVAYPV